MSDHLNGSHLDADLNFTITNGQVTGIARVAGSATVTLPLPSNTTFTVGTGKVTATVTRGATTDTRTYTVDAADSTLYHLAQDTRTYDTAAATARSYGFTVAAGKVTAIVEGIASGKNHTVDVSKLPGTAFAVSGNTITETSVHGNTIETVQFVTTDGSTYKIASDTLTFVSAGAATTLLSVEPEERMSFTFSGSTVTAAQVVRLDGTTAAAHANAKLTTTYTQPAAGYVVETVTDGTHSRYEVFHDGNGDGIYTAVAHGTGTTVDLVGLQAQISPLINTLL
jgi:hypothetical protein